MSGGGSLLTCESAALSESDERPFDIDSLTSGGEVNAIVLPLAE